MNKAVGIGFKRTGDIVLAVGERAGHLGQSVWLREILGREEGPPPPVDLRAEKRTGDFIRGAINAGRSEEHTSELQSLMRNSYAVCGWKKRREGYNSAQGKNGKGYN